MKLSELKRAQLSHQVHIDELENESTSIRRELDDARTLVMRQQNRIFRLEEQLEEANKVDPM